MNKLVHFGWITTNGNFIACCHHCHKEVLVKKKLFHESNNPELEAEKQGWLKITMRYTGEIALISFQDPNQEQINTLCDWCNKNNVKFPPKIEQF